jgi:hypothetical protein
MGLTVIESIRLIAYVGITLLSLLALVLTEFKEMKSGVGVGVLFYRYEGDTWFYYEDRCGEQEVGLNCGEMASAGTVFAAFISLQVLSCGVAFFQLLYTRKLVAQLRAEIISDITLTISPQLLRKAKTAKIYWYSNLLISCFFTVGMILWLWIARIDALRLEIELASAVLLLDAFMSY